MAVNGTSSSISSALGVAGKGIGGLATGLNTDELVAALTSGTKLKIAKQGQQKQLLNWKMTAYRSMTTALNAFQTKFLKTSTKADSNTNILSSRFFNTYKATSNSDKVSVSATSGAQTGNFTIDKVTQLATAESYTSTNKMSTTLKMDIKAEDIKEDMFTGQTLRLEVDGFSTKTIKLDSLNQYVTDNGDGTFSLDEDFDKGLQKLLSETYKSSGVVTVNKDSSGNITLDSASAKVTVNSSNTLLGLDAGDSNRVSTKTKIGDLDAFSNVQGDVLTFNINGVEISVNKRDDIDTLLSKVTNSGADVRMEYDQYKDVFTLTSKKYGADSSFEISDVQGNLMNQIFGAKGGSSIGTDYLTTGDGIIFGADLATKIDTMTAAEKRTFADTLSRMSFQLTVNGETRTVKLDTVLGIPSKKLSEGSYTAEDIYSAINKGIQSAFPNSAVEFGEGPNGRTAVASGHGEAFNISGSGEFAKLLGMNSDGAKFTVGNTITDYGNSGKIDSSTIDASLSTDAGFLNIEKLIDSDTGLLTKNSFEMTINGVTKTVNVTPAKDKDGNDIPITNDNFLARLNAAVQGAFGSDAKGVSFSATYDKMPGYAQVVDPDDYVERADGYYKVDPDTGEETKAFNKAPEGKPAGYYNGDVMWADAEGFRVDADGEKLDMFPKTIGVNITLNIAGNYAGVVETSVSMSGDLSEAMGFAADANNGAASAATVKFDGLKGGADIVAGTLTVNGKTVSYDSDTIISDFLYDLNDALGEKGAAGIKDGKLFIKSEDGDLTVTDTSNMLEKFFGIKGGEYKTATADYKSSFATEEVKAEDGQTLVQGEDYDFEKDGKYFKYASTHTAAKNALLTIDGKDIEWSSNTVSYNGVNLTLNDISTEKIRIGVQSDPDDVVKRITEWMDDYNALVYTLNSAINEGKNREYEPLTDDQKAEMTDEQVKTWETEAKKGLLRNDQTLRQILTDMRSALYEKVESAGISLYDIGIVTKSGLSDMNQAGQLEFDPNAAGGGEQRLRDMLVNNPDSVRMLFTDSENGIGAKLNKVISQAANTSSVDRGSLVRLAGTEQLTGDNTSQIKNKIDALDKYIAALKSRYENEYNRFWKKFSSLETSVQKMNTQSSWLQSQ